VQVIAGGADLAPNSIERRGVRAPHA